MEVLHALAYVVGAALIAVLLLWLLGIIFKALTNLEIPVNVRILIGVFLFIIILITAFNQYPIHIKIK